MDDQSQESLPTVQAGRLVLTAQDEKEAGQRVAYSNACAKCADGMLEHGFRGGSAFGWTADSTPDVSG